MTRALSLRRGMTGGIQRAMEQC